MKSSPLVQLVVAYSNNRAIGRDNTLPWRLPSDLAHFKRATLGQPIVMGRNTWESLGRPLPGRPNLVISRNPDYQAVGATVYPTLESALAACHNAERICIIGGEQIFRLALDIADEVIATEVHAHVDGDTFFPPMDKDTWQEAERLPQPEENGYAFDFVVYRRVVKA
ncbi:dihydrofolate reductase [Alcaligenaceae bacterium]|nr:dihydrofolate reductase [Alcaligenaceae bacterium]